MENGSYFQNHDMLIPTLNKLQNIKLKKQQLHSKKVNASISMKITDYGLHMAGITSDMQKCFN